MSDLEHAAVYHPADVVCLGGAHLVVAVRPDGESWPWLLGDAGSKQGCHCRDCAPHDQLGPLPASVRSRINQCQAIGTQTGRRCSRSAPLGEPFCYQHRER